MTRIVIIDDDPLVRSGLRMIIESADDLTIVGEGGDGAEAVGLVREFRPDVVLMDVQMPVMDGLTATRAIRAHEAASGARRMLVIMLTANALDEHIRAGQEAGADEQRHRGGEGGQQVAGGEHAQQHHQRATTLAVVGRDAVHLGDRQREQVVRLEHRRLVVLHVL